MRIPMLNSYCMAVTIALTSAIFVYIAMVDTRHGNTEQNTVPLTVILLYLSFSNLLIV